MAKDRSIALKFGDVETTRDYAERLKFGFDNEIMFEHFDRRMQCPVLPQSKQYGSEQKKRPQHISTHTSLMDRSKMQQQHTRTC